MCEYYAGAVCLDKLTLAGTPAWPPLLLPSSGTEVRSTLDEMTDLSLYHN